MTSADNKRALQAAWEGMAQGDPRDFLALMADDFVWEIPGTSSWSGRWESKAAVRQELFGPLFAQFADTYTNRALRFIGDGDTVVVECRGKVATRRGGRYDNSYCYICRFDGTRMAELTEYMDTALADRELDPPAAKPKAPSR